MRKSGEEKQLPFVFDQERNSSCKNASNDNVVNLREARIANEKAVIKKQENEVIDKILTLSRKINW
jgi:hypothetical protein